MKEFKKTKPLVYLLRDMKIGDTIVVDKLQVRTVSVRQAVTNLRKEGYEFFASTKGLLGKIAVTKISNPEQQC